MLTNDRQISNVQREVYIVSACLNIISILFSIFLSPWWIALAIGVNIFVLEGGITGRCKMAKILSKLPYEPNSCRECGNISKNNGRVNVVIYGRFGQDSMR